MAGTEIFVIVAVIVFAAIFVPILFDENPAAFLENSLCGIFPGNGPPFICNSISSNVTFTGLNGIDIFTNSSISNSTVFWNFTGSGIITNQTDETHTNVGGGAEVFKNETNFNANFRTLTGSGGVTVTQNDETINIQTGGGGGPPLQNINNGSGPVFQSASEGDTATFIGQGIAISNSSSVTFTLNATTNELLDVVDIPCVDSDIYVYNASSSQFECMNSQSFATDNLIDNEEVFFPHLSASGGDDVIVSFTNYDSRAVRFRDNLDTSATWKYVVPQNLNTTNTSIQFKLFWFTQDNAAGNVCWEFLTNNVAENDDLDFTLTSHEELCTPNLGIDILALDIFTVNSTSHNFQAGELAYIQIKRDASFGNPSDTHEDHAFALIGELRWLN